MNTLAWDNALSPSVISAVEQKIAGRKNRVAVMILLRWIVACGLWYRTKKGFHLVRGSDPRLQEGLKSNPDLIKLGLTEAKIRGAIKLLVMVGILEVIPYSDDSGPRFRWNFRLQKRNRPVLYRFASWIHDMIRSTRDENRDSSSRKPSFSSSDLSHKALHPQGGCIVGEKTSKPESEMPPPPRPVVKTGLGLKTGLADALDRLATGVWRGAEAATPVPVAPVTEPARVKPPASALEDAIERALAAVRAKEAGR